MTGFSHVPDEASIRATAYVRFVSAKEKPRRSGVFIFGHLKSAK
jgi:hypothetical protein